MADAVKNTEHRQDSGHDAPRPHIAEHANITGANDLQQRLQQREALKAFRLTRDPGNAFSIDMGCGKEVKDKRPISPVSKLGLSDDFNPKFVDISKLKAEGRPEAMAHDEQSKTLEHLQTATESIIQTASARFGADEIRNMHIKNDDLGSAVSALVFGPVVYKTLGAAETTNLGKRLLVFGLAPILGMANEAHKQFTQSPMQTVHEGSANYLTGAAIGAMLEHIHPAVMTIATAGGASLFLKDQLSSPEHRARNREISAISSRIDKASNTELLGMLDRTKTLIGPELYKGLFVLATGGPGIPEGGAVNLAVKQEARALPELNAEDSIKHLQSLGHDAWDTLKTLLDQQQLKPATVGDRREFTLSMTDHGLSNRPDNAIRNILPGRTIDGAEDFNIELEKIRDSIKKISAKPIAEVLDAVESINKSLLAIGKRPVVSREQASAIASVEDAFLAHLTTVREDFHTLQPQADAIQAKPTRSKSEDDVLDKFFALEDTLYAVVTERLKTLYGWNEHAIVRDKEIAMTSGAGTQREVSNALADLFNSGLENNQEVKNILNACGVSLERAKGWVGIPVPSKSGADHAGCDYLIVNKTTSEFYPFDVTEKTLSMKTDKLVETRMTNPRLEFPDKKIPHERRDFVIGVAPPLVKENLIYRIVSSTPGISDMQATLLVDKQRQKQLAEIMGHTIAQPSKLNLFDTPLPSINKATPESRQAYELWRFKNGLVQTGHPDWANAMKKSIGYVGSQNKGIPFYD